MTLIHLVVVLIVIGVLLYLVNSVIPMDARIRQIISTLVLVTVVLWLLAVFFPSLSIDPGRIR